MARHPWVKKGTKLTFKDGTVGYVRDHNIDGNGRKRSSPSYGMHIPAQKGYPSNYSAWHSPKDFIDHPKHTPKKPTNESYKIHYPSLKKLANLEYTDPRVNTEGKRIHVEKEGNLRLGETNIQGHYVVYEDEGFPGSYIGVHIGSELSEDTGETPINVVAIDPNRSAVINRVAYRLRNSRIAESEAVLTTESREISLMRNMGEILNERVRPVRFRELKVGDKFRFEDDPDPKAVCQKVSATHYKHDGVKYKMPSNSDMVIKEGTLDEKKAKRRTSGPKRTDTKYGSPSDRGSADRYYGRPFDPHFYERGSYSSKRHDIKDPSSINVQGDKRQKRRINRGLKLTKKQYGSYKDSFENQEDRKDYGE